MNDMIEPIEIGKIKSRYIRVNISEFVMMIPRCRVEGLSLYLTKRVNSSFRAPTRAGIVRNEFVDMLTRGRGEAENMTQHVVTNAGRLVNASDDGVIRAQKVVVRRFIYRGRAITQPRGLISIRERIVLRIGGLIVTNSFRVDILLSIDFSIFFFMMLFPIIFDFRLAPME